MKAKIIVLFNHKGGVSKTTTTYHLAWKLAKKGKKVLLVDGDPQCNLTSLLLADQFYDYYEAETTKNNNLKDAVRVAFEGKPTPIVAIDCFVPDGNPNLFLIPGHMDLSSYDGSLSLALNSGNAITTLQNLPGAFYELVRLCCERYDIDYVFIDMNPGLSAINQSLFMMCDAFIIPTNPDPFSVMALQTLRNVLPRWKAWLTQNRLFFEEASYPLPEAEMKFLGEIIQRFNLRKGSAAKPYVGKIEEIKEEISTKLVPTLSQYNMVYDISSAIANGTLSDYCLAEISEFGALLQKAHTAHKPVFDLTDGEIHETGTVLEQMVSNRTRFNEIFEKISQVVLEVLK